MIFPQPRGVGSITLSPSGPFTTGERTTLTLSFTVGKPRLAVGSQLRVGLPNTGWEKPVPPQSRYWDELVRGEARRYAPFHPVNTTASVRTKGKAVIALECMERMLLADEDPAEAYWRWWITATVEEANLSRGDKIILTYGDPRFTGQKARIQTFPENDLTVSVYLNAGDGKWVRPVGAPLSIDVTPGPAARANVVMPSVARPGKPLLRVALTDACHCRPRKKVNETLVVRGASGRAMGKAKFSNRTVTEVALAKPASIAERLLVTNRDGSKVWGESNPSMPADKQGLQLFWGDLHAQSEYHVMHSQKKDARQAGWSRGISCGSPDDVYQYAQEVSLLDFVAITDQGAITGIGWEILQRKAAEYYRPGKFVTFNAYEAGSPVGHRNVFFRDSREIPRENAETFSYLPEFLYRFYAGRSDVLMIPHHVKTWTDWSYHDPELEPVMEVYSCWGQSENPSMERWDKGMTPGAGAWEALRRGYRLGMIASTDNHVGMPGRSYPHDRQIHTPFPGGLAAVWAPELSREAIFDAVRARRCYGTTGARILLKFEINGKQMGEELQVPSPRTPLKLRIQMHGTCAISSVEILRNGETVHTAKPETGKAQEKISFEWADKTPLSGTGYYYVRVKQADGEMAWTSPIWVIMGE